MQFNDSNFGNLVRILEESVFNENEYGTGISPPPEAFILIDDSEANLLDDSGDTLIVD